MGARFSASSRVKVDVMNAVGTFSWLVTPSAMPAMRMCWKPCCTLQVKLETKPVTDTRIDLKFVRTEFKVLFRIGSKMYI